MGPLLLSLDWRHGLVEARLTSEPTGGLRLILGHGPDELVLCLSRESVDALTLTCLAFDRESPDARDPD